MLILNKKDFKNDATVASLKGKNIRLHLKSKLITFGQILFDSDFDSNLSKGFIRFIKSDENSKSINLLIDKSSKLFSINEIEIAIAY
jgi:hypothetical protein